MEKGKVVTRTQEEILDRIKKRRGHDFFGFEWLNYIQCLSFQNAKEFLKDEVTSDEWHIQTMEEVKVRAVEYMSFAWEKANSFRGISASRSISHYIAWMWLLGNNNTERWEDYRYYGKIELIEICVLLDLDSNEWDDGVRRNNE